MSDSKAYVCSVWFTDGTGYVTPSMEACSEAYWMRHTLKLALRDGKTVDWIRWLSQNRQDAAPNPELS